MKTRKFFFQLCLGMLAIFSQVDAQTSPNNLKSFSKLILNGTANVVLVPSQEFGYAIEPQERAGEIRVVQSEDEVRISDDRESDFFRKGNKSTIKIFCSCLSKIQLRGTGDISAKGDFTGCSIDMDLSGAGDISLSGNYMNISVDLSGAGDIELKGKCSSLTAFISGAGDLNARTMEAGSVKVSLSGAGKAEVNSLNTLDANVSGIGSILYAGDPQERKVRITGIGSVRQIGANTKMGDEESGSNQGQEKEDTTSIRIGDTKILIIDGDDGKRQEVEIETPSERDLYSNSFGSAPKHRFKHIWSGFELGINGYYHDAFHSFSIPNKEYELDYPRSININLNPFEYHLPIIQNYLSLGSGLGFSFNRFMFDKSITLTANTEILDTVMTGVDYRKNMLKVSYLTLPLFLQFASHSNPHKAFHLGAGIIGGMRLGSRTKQIWDENGRQRKVVKDAYNLNPFRYGLMLRFGYRRFNFYADYALSTLFKAGKGPELYPFTAGITLIPFRS